MTSILPPARIEPPSMGRPEASPQHLACGSNVCGYTLLEVMLAIGLCALLAAVSLPAFSGWLTEHHLRSLAGTFIDTVQGSKIIADQSGRAQTIIFQVPGKQDEKPPPPDTHIFQEDPSAHWTFQSFGAKDAALKLDRMQIDAHGLVDPVVFRVQEGSSFVEYRFDVLTGHAIEEASSF